MKNGYTSATSVEVIRNASIPVFQCALENSQSAFHGRDNIIYDHNMMISAGTRNR